MNEEPKPSGAETPDPWSAPSTTPQAEGSTPESTPPAAEPVAASTDPTPAAIPTEPPVASTPPPVVPPVQAAPAASSGGNSGGLPLLPLAAAALIPAVIVGLLVFFIAGGSDSGGGSCGATLDGFVRLSLDQGDEIESTCDLPDGFPDDLPVYSGAELDGGFAIKSDQGTTFIVAYSTSADKSEVYDYFLDRMDEDPWQIELSREADDFTGMQFSRPDSADIQGSITISHSDLDDRTSIFIFLLDASQTSLGSQESKPIPTTSHALPPDFPKDVPIFKGKADSIVTETYFQRDAGRNAFLISFLTKDADVDVINFYTQEFQKRGWTVKDGQLEAGDFALSIDFDDGKPTKEVQGSIRADVYSEDASYTEVNLIVQVSASRGRGN